MAITNSTNLTNLINFTNLPCVLDARESLLI